MKLIIDIPEETLGEVNCRGLFLNPRDKENLVNSIKNGTPIPENATNGDIIKTLFPQEGDFETDFDTDWWSSPYKRGDTE